MCWGGAQTRLAAKESRPSNPDKGEIILAGLVLVPGDGTNTGVPGLSALQGALVVIEGTKHVTTRGARPVHLHRGARG